MSTLLVRLRETDRKLDQLPWYHKLAIECLLLAALVAILPLFGQIYHLGQSFGAHVYNTFF